MCVSLLCCIMVLLSHTVYSGNQVQYCIREQLAVRDAIPQHYVVILIDYHQ